jgi:hypothetical protein
MSVKMDQVSKMEEKLFMSSSNTYMSRSLPTADISFKYNVTVILFLGVSSMVLSQLERKPQVTLRSLAKHGEKLIGSLTYEIFDFRFFS